MRHRGEAGYSLLEVMAAVSVLAVCLTMMLGGYAVTLSSAGSAEDYTVAALLAQEALVALETSAPGPGLSDGDFGAAFPDFYWAATVTPLPERPGLLQVDLVVRFGRDEREHRLRTLLLAEPAA